jgi:uncharacterized protein
MNPTIQTRTGLYFNFSYPDTGMIEIDDIAHALANTCRYGGHCNKFYSVAQHSVLVSQIAPKAHAAIALMHDAAEAYIGDIPTPLKQLLPDFKKIERKIEQVIAQKFGLPDPMPESVKIADRVALAMERRDIMDPSDEVWEPLIGILPLPRKVVPLSPDKAKALFMKRYKELFT